MYGRDEQAIEAAKQLGTRLSVIVLLTGAGEGDPAAPRRACRSFAARSRGAAGHLGAFEVRSTIMRRRRSRRERRSPSSAPRDGVRLRFDLILDLAARRALFPAHAKRDGYFKPDVGNPAEVQRALFDLTDLVGEFEKPRYVQFQAELCAHSRLAADRLHALPRGLPGVGDPAGRRRGRDRPLSVRRLRRLPQRLPDGSGGLRLSAGARPAGAPAHAAFDLPARPVARAPRSWCTTTPMAAS